jgi:serralysin
MPTVSDIENTVTSGLNHIDALLDIGPDWNYLTPAGNTLLFTFSVAAGNESGQAGQQAFSAAQQTYARQAMGYLAQITGVQFSETGDGAAAQIHLCNIDIPDAGTTGLCSWSYHISYDNNNQLLSYDNDTYVYLDNNEWGARNANLTPGAYGYETLLHELGHALGLKHPFEGSIQLTGGDTTANTLMSYTDAGGPYATYRAYDIAALNWIYGQDGLRGNLGMNSVTGARYLTGTAAADTLTGTAFNDTLEGDGGNDMINGGDGTDTLVLRGTHDAYTFSKLASGALLSSGPDGNDTLASIEIVRFSDASYPIAQLLDTTPPAPPVLSVPRNAFGYVAGDSAFVFGLAEPGAAINVYTATALVGSTYADGIGSWSLTTTPFPDGENYQIAARATDAAGNISEVSALVSFNVDAHAPPAPTASMSAAPGGNQPVFNGSGEAGTTIQLINGHSVIGQTTVGPGGGWLINSNPIPNGDYNVAVVSSDKADNATAAANHLLFTIASANNLTGTAGNDWLRPTAGNNALDGQDGVDFAVYDTRAHANFTVAKDVNGFTVTDHTGTNGLDSLVNMERIVFSDASVALDIHGAGGEAFRLYQAAFDRQPDLAGLGYWIHGLDSGLTLAHAAGNFMESKEYTDLYGSNTSDEAFIGALYNNILHRAPEQAGHDYWINELQVYHITRAEVLVNFSESVENQAQVIGSIENGILFIPYG